MRGCLFITEMSCTFLMAFYQERNLVHVPQSCLTQGPSLPARHLPMENPFRMQGARSLGSSQQLPREAEAPEEGPSDRGSRCCFRRFCTSPAALTRRTRSAATTRCCVQKWTLPGGIPPSGAEISLWGCPMRIWLPSASPPKADGEPYPSRLHSSSHRCQGCG